MVPMHVYEKRKKDFKRLVVRRLDMRSIKTIKRLKMGELRIPTALEYDGFEGAVHINLFISESLPVTIYYRAYHPVSCAE